MEVVKGNNWSKATGTATRTGNVTGNIGTKIGNEIWTRTGTVGSSESSEVSHQRAVGLRHEASTAAVKGEVTSATLIRTRDIARITAEAREARKE